MRIAYLIKVRPDLRDIVPEDVEDYVQIFVDDNGLYSESDLNKLNNMDAFIVSMEPVNKQILSAAPNIKIAQRLGVGYETFDLKALAQRKIPACNIDGVNKEAVAEHNMTLMLALSKRLFHASDLTEAANWSASRMLTEEAFELKGKTLGIVGFGDSGSSLAKRAHPFEMNIIYSEIKDVNLDLAKKLDAERVDHDELYIRSDIICICTDLNDTTKRMIDTKALSLMNSNTTLICCARGGILDENAVASALKTGAILQAGIDVFETEPIERNNPLIGIKNCILTSHVAGVTKPTTARIWEWAHENVRSVVKKGERPRWIRNGL
tara:strand:+ start:449 stop:1417 length:969 start_codon:yes stop_codon:yes gene_type:complete